MGNTDETKDAVQDSKPKGYTVTMPKGDASDDKGGTTSDKKNTVSFTEETQKKAIEDALSGAGRTSAAFDSRKTALDARDQTLKDAEVKEVQRQKDRDTKEREAVKDDPDKLSIVEQRQQLRDREAEVNRQKAENEATTTRNQTAIDAANATRLEADISTIGTKHKVDPKWLKELGITDLKVLEEVAKGSTGRKPFNPDGGENLGGMSDEAIREAYCNNPNDPHTREAYLDSRKRRGI